MKRPKHTINVNLSIAKAHELAGQLVGLQLSLANILALLVSAASIVAGATTLAVQQFPSSWLIWIAAGGIGIGLALLIEGLTLSALIRMRVAGRALRNLEAKVRAVREKQLSTLRMPDPADPTYPVIKKHYREARTLIEREWRRTYRQHARPAQRDRRNSLVLAFAGCISSMCGGGLFYHALLASLGPIASVALSIVFTLAVTGTFVSSEVFKDLQEEAIRENFVNGDLAEYAMHQGTRMQSLWAVHERIGTYLQSQEAQEVVAKGGRQLVMRIVEELHQDLRRSLPPVRELRLTSYLESPLMADTTIQSQGAGAEKEANPEPDGQGYVTQAQDEKLQPESPDQATDSRRSEQAESYGLSNQARSESHPEQDMSYGLSKQATSAETSGQAMGYGLSEQGKGYELASGRLSGQAPGYELASQHAPQVQEEAQNTPDLDVVEQAMLQGIQHAPSEVRTELLRLARTQSLTLVTQALWQHYPRYARYFTEQRVARVMAVALQSFATEKADPPFTSSESNQRAHQQGTPGYASTKAIAQEQDIESQQWATGSLLLMTKAGYDVQSQNRTTSQGLWATDTDHERKPRQATTVGQPFLLSNETSQLQSHSATSRNIRHFPVARTNRISQTTRNATSPTHRERIKKAFQQAQQEDRPSTYHQIAQVAGVGYSTVKKHARSILAELQTERDHNNSIAVLSLTEEGE